MKVLNLYAGIGGNRKLWEGVEVTAVEYNEEIAAIYKDHFPKDNVIVGDAHEYLINHFQEYDFIWASPPCPSHSRFRFMTTKMKDEGHKRPIIYPDMNLYQEIILMQHYCKGLYCIENVKSYYDPLIKPQESGRHYYWANFRIGNYKSDNNNFIKSHINDLSAMHGFDLSKYNLGKRKDQVLRNCVNPEQGQYILDCAMGIIRKKETKQQELFDV